MDGFSKVGVAVLAAGAAARMGAAKLLLPFAGSTLLERALDAAMGCAADAAAVVTGAYHSEMQPLVAGRGGAAARDGRFSHGATGRPSAASDDGARPVFGQPALAIVRNRRWATGQASSVRAAVRFAQSRGCTALLLMVADQPYVTSTHLNALIAEYDQGRSQAYLAANDHGHGNPALFDRSLFGDLLNLKGDEGARALFRARRDIAARHVFFDDAHLFDDVDTPADLRRIEEAMGCE